MNRDQQNPGQKNQYEQDERQPIKAGSPNQNYGNEQGKSASPQPKDDKNQGGQKNWGDKDNEQPQGGSRTER